MSNPWKESAADIAITPLTYLLASFQDSTEKKDISDRNSSESLVHKLRLADDITQRRRDLKYKNKIENMYAETTLTNALVEDLDSIFKNLNECFNSFLCGNLLKNAYENAVYSAVIEDDNMNEDNRAKIVEMVRETVKAIRKLKDTKAGKPLQVRDDKFNLLLRSTSIMVENKDINDYSADELCELVNECSLQISGMKNMDVFAGTATPVISLSES